VLLLGLFTLLSYVVFSFLCPDTTLFFNTILRACLLSVSSKLLPRYLVWAPLLLFSTDLLGLKVRGGECASTSYVVPESGSLSSVVAPYVGGAGSSGISQIPDPDLVLLEPPVALNPASVNLHSDIIHRFSLLTQLYGGFSIYALKEPYYFEQVDKLLFRSAAQGSCRVSLLLRGNTN
jgi:hypothetical protein